MLATLRRGLLTPIAAAVCAALAGCEQPQTRKAPVDLTRLSPAEFGKPISFGAGGNGEQLMLSGWGHPEPPFTWSDGTAASIALRLPPTRDVVQLHFKMAGMNVPDRIPFQRVDLYVNAERLARWQVADENVFTVTLPEKFLAGDNPLLVVDFYMPKAASPAFLGIGSDQRRLGVRLAELYISRAPRQAATAHAAP